ncbi:hypothetical protein Cgig2_024701 [Carnegiea gigantea]|uniref:non-specific serine/threonine protein kinase n=1 Tax=Carnegiea gigantea TaxID=171969 RepID=A0A9Q1GX70_9CARY|nr:hypothetical protein Cgig2_024701 [Carnegiea gigantea]
MEDDEDLHPSTTTTMRTTAMMTTTNSGPPPRVVVIVVFVIFLTSLPIRATADDASIMYNLAKGLKPTPSGWSGRQPCKWQGVRCDSSGRVTSISLNSKSLSGTLPPDLPQLSNLEILSIQNNFLSGTVPALANMSSLQEVYLDWNAFSGVGDPFLVGLPNLQTFSIENNPLSTWTIPLTLADSSGLQAFRAGNTSLSGPIPDIFKSLPSLTTLRLSYNNLTGFLPASFAGSSIQYLWINNQKEGLTGTLDVLGGMTSLAQAWVHVNDFVGPIPDLSKCTSLFDLELRDNHLTGVVHPSIFDLPKLVNISLQNNRLQGPVPVFKKGVQVSLGTSNSFCNPSPGQCDPQVSALIDIASGFGYPLELADSWIGNNACKDWSHVTCDSSGKVTVVNFAKKNWSGTISPAFANLTSLNSIILNDNNLVGSIPNELSNLKALRLFDVSNNNLTGKVPNFASNVVVKTDGNKFIGTSVDTSASLKAPPGAINNSNSPALNSARGSGNESESSNSGGDQPRSRLSTSKIVGIVIGCILGAIAVGLLLFYFIKKKRKGKKYDGPKRDDEQNLKMSPVDLPSRPSPSGLSNNPTYDSGSVIPIEVLREVTNNFSERNMIGKGGFGVVYKGILHDGTQIAVKRMEFVGSHNKGKNEFEAEIAVLSKVRHRHLVALLGYCIHENERFVVYEYMPQGTLAQHLFEGHRFGFSPLTWKQRLVIALDVARGIEYLHSLAQQSFIHRDLKPSNILLGDDMRAKVSDFGLVKNAPDQGKYSVETRLAGTFGYLAPEYASKLSSTSMLNYHKNKFELFITATGRVTTKVDVFAFGVVLMELITGRKALDESRPEEEAQLVTWFRRVLIAKDILRTAIDPKLETHDQEIYNSICKVAELSGYCTAREPQQRPDMSHAVNILSPLVELWKPADQSDGDETESSQRHVSLPQALQRWQAGETITSISGYSSGAPTTPGLGDSFTNMEGR